MQSSRHRVAILRAVKHHGLPHLGDSVLFQVLRQRRESLARVDVACGAPPHVAVAMMFCFVGSPQQNHQGGQTHETRQMDQFRSSPRITPTGQAFRNRPGTPFPTSRKLRRIGGCITGDVTDGTARVVESVAGAEAKKESNFGRLLIRALREAQIAIGAFPRKLERLSRKTEDLRDSLEKCKTHAATRNYHNSHRNIIHIHDTEIARFLQELKFNRDFWWTATREEASVLNKDDAVADLLATSAWLAAKFRDDVNKAIETLVESRRFVADHKSALAQLDAGDEPTQDADLEDTQRLGLMGGGRDGSLMLYIVDDRACTLHGTLCASSLLDSAGDHDAWK